MNPIRTTTCLLLALPLGGALFAQAAVRPAGIYCSCPPTNATSSSFLASVAAKPYVDGFLVRIAWADVEPSPGTFDWTLLDNQLALIAQAGKKAALAVVQGRGTPAWLGTVGAATVTWPFHGVNTTTAVPWDATYLQRWSMLVAALGARYDSDPTVSLVHATHATQNGFEMQLPFLEEQTFRALGYTDTVYAQSWSTVLDTFLQAFPSKPVDVDVHPIWGSDAVAAQVVAHGVLAAPDRFGAFGGWWSVHNAVNTYPGMQEIFASTAGTSFANVQNVGSFVTTPSRYDFDPATYEASFDVGLDTGIRYFEVWNADLLDPSLDSLFTRVAADVHCGGWYQLYPAPATPPAFAHHLRGCPEPLGQVSFELDGGPTGSPAAILFGTAREALSVIGETLLVGPLQALVSIPLTLDATGHGALTLTLPSSTAVTTWTSQGGVIDLAAGTLALSNAVESRR